MTREDIIRMAREAGFVDYELDDGTDEAFDIRYVRFAKLVAEHEREACAKVCEKLSIDMEQMPSWGAQTCAKQIRARNKE